MTTIVGRDARPSPPAHPTLPPLAPWAGFRPVSWAAPTLVAAASATMFLLVHPAVGDLWAARARQSAAGHGVGLTYWFAWYGGGTAPGSYSVLTPILSAAVGAPLLGALATVAITPLSRLLASGTRHPVEATWTATVTCGLSLWSGRIPFAVGTAAAVATLLAVRARRADRSVPGAVVTALCSPVSGAFVVLGLVGAVVTGGARRRVAVATAAGAGVTLVLLAVVFGAPGPEGFPAGQAVLATAALLLFLVARPERVVRDVVVVSALLCPLIAAVPNGMGSNFERLVWVCLPPAVVATARVRRPLGVLAVATAVGAGALGTVRDLAVGHAPMSSVAYYAPLLTRLDRLPDLSSYRVEYVPDGAHTAAYVLLDHAMLARGYETQADHAFDSAIDRPAKLDAVTYKAWLDNNAVGYVAIDATTLRPTPEYTLVARHRPAYLRPVWGDATWRLYRVVDPSPIVPAPGRVVDADQSSLQVSVARAGRLPVRVRWSDLLTVDSPPGVPPAVVRSSGDGWTVLVVSAPGRYRLHGR